MHITVTTTLSVGLYFFVLLARPYYICFAQYVKYFLAGRSNVTSRGSFKIQKAPSETVAPFPAGYIDAKVVI